MAAYLCPFMRHENCVPVARHASITSATSGIGTTMKYFSSGLLLLATSTAFCAVGAPPARAQFYHLDGRFECLNRAGAVCYDATVAALPPKRADTAFPPEPADNVKPAAADQKTASPATTSSDAVSSRDALRALLTQESTRPPAQPVDPLQAIAVRVGAKAPTPADLAILEAQARAGDVKATELLAWCAYAGIGGKPDPIRAYFLYGQGAASGNAAMARNQAAVYANMLTSEQRQQIAEIENGQ